MNKFRKAATSIVVLLCALISSCGRDERPVVDVTLLSKNTYVSVAQHTLVLPFVALEDYAYRQQSFSLSRKSDSEGSRKTNFDFLRNSSDPKTPVRLDDISITVRTYGWNDSDLRQLQLCPLLTRKWAQSVCNNPWAAIQQALPSNRFRLVDLSHLKVEEPRASINCINSGTPRREIPKEPGEAVIICEAQVYGGDINEFHSAVVRIDGDLGAVWIVWRNGQNGETAESMAEREGKAIVDFVKFGLGMSENFKALQDSMCSLRRPRSIDGPQKPDCLNEAASHAHHSIR